MKKDLNKLLPKAPKKTRIGILGGSFDPPHLCHQLLALSTLAVEPIDMLWILPCANHPFQKKMTPFKHRLKMCQIAFSRLNKKVHVVPLEEHLPFPNYTVQTLTTIHRLRPGVQLFFTIGSDLLEHIPSWHEPKKLTKLCQIIIYKRVGFPIRKVPGFLKNQLIHTSITLPNVQSGQIRTALKEKKTMLDKEVMAYVQANHLYDL